MQEFHTYTFRSDNRVRDLYCRRQRERAAQSAAVIKQGPTFALASRVRAVRPRDSARITPQMRMQHCRDALERLDRAGWKRSYHQRLFHDDFLVSLCVCITSHQHSKDSSALVCHPNSELVCH